MIWIARLGLLWCCLGSLSSTLQAQSYNDRDFVIQLYREYYQRTPNNQEVNVWLQGMRRGDSRAEVQAAIMGSDEFYQRCGSNPNTWINAAFSILNNRAPNTDEFYFWSRRLQALRQDRRALSREFIKNYGGQRPVFPTQLPTTPDMQMSSYTAQMQTTAVQLQQAIRQEFSGFQGTLLGLQASNLVSVSASSANAINNWRSDPTTASRALANVQRTLQSLNSSLRDNGWSPNSRYYLNQANQIYRTIADSVGMGSFPDSGGGVQYPPTLPPWNPSIPIPPVQPGPNDGLLTRAAANRLGRQLERAVARANDTYFVVQSAARQDYRYSSLLSEMNRLGSELQRNAQSIVEGYRHDLLRRDLSSTDSQYQRIDAFLRGGFTDIRVSDSWSETVRSWERFKSDAARELGNFGATGFPRVGSGDNSYFILQLIDQMISQCDALLAQLNQMMLIDYSYTRMFIQTRELRGSLVQLRQNFQRNPGFNSWARDFESARQSLNQINQMEGQNRSSRTYSQSVDFSQINQSLQQLANSLGQN